MKWYSGLRLATALAAILLAIVTLPASALTLTEAQKLIASDGALADKFGSSVAIDGDTAIIGAYLDDDNGLSSGSAYVFTRSSGVWSEQQKLTASDAAFRNYFGISVAIDGDTAVIGAYYDDDNGPFSGSAYVFTRSSGLWSEQQKLTASDGASNDLFGRSVAIDGDTAVIGAYLDGDNGLSSGSVYVFTRSSGVWSEQQKLTASDGASGDYFGFSVAIDDDTVVIAAGNDDDNGFNSGSAYVFTRSSGLWSEQQKLTASDGASNDVFGQSVAIDGDTVVIGAQSDSVDEPYSGSAYVFTRSSGVWSEKQKLNASDGAFADFFGSSVAVDGDTAVIGSEYDDDNGTNSGSAYVFTRSNGIWSEQHKLLASDGVSGDGLGRSTIDGDTAVIGVSLNTGARFSNGSAYVFDLVTDDQGPLTESVLATPNPAAVNTPITLTAYVDDSATRGSSIALASYFVDGGTGESMAALDGSFDEVSEDVTANIGAFGAAGMHTVCVSGTDTAGNTGPEECVSLGVYAPTAGFVKGGGWINSPAGAYTADPALAGKAIFGFVSRYKKGQQTPAGKTVFQFKAGDLNFHFDTYEWLVIAGARAQFKGTGTINGAGNYGFMLYAVDENLAPSTDADLFRIKIWDTDNNNAVVYDNEMGRADDAHPTTQLGGGSIVIHNNRKK